MEKGKEEEEEEKEEEEEEEEKKDSPFEKGKGWVRASAAAFNTLFYFLFSSQTHFSAQELVCIKFCEWKGVTHHSHYLSYIF